MRDYVKDCTETKPGIINAVNLARKVGFVRNLKTVATLGYENIPADYIGKHVIIFRSQTDLSPLCTPEFMTFASL